MTRVLHRAPEPVLDGVHSAVLRDACQAAVRAVNHCWSSYSTDELVETVKIGADGTPTFRMDDIIESEILQTADAHGVNLLSEELGFHDNGSAVTLVVDPLDGSANAASGVPLSCFSGVIVVDDQPVEALSLWLEGGQTLHARAGEDVTWRTSGLTDPASAAIGLLRPKSGPYGDTTDAWVAISRATSRVRILSSTVLESMLVAQGGIDGFADPGSDTHRLVDLLAATVLLPPAGGVVIDAFGRPIEMDVDMTRRWSGVIAATPQLAGSLAATIRAHVSVPASVK